MTSYFYALKLLLEQNITSLPIDWDDIIHISNNMNITLVPFKNKEEILSDLSFIHIDKLPSDKAISILYNGEFIVYYCEKLSAAETISVIAHEFGHIEMRHITDTGILGKNSDPALDEPQEKEADDFARSFLAPVCILKHCKVKTVFDVQKLTNLCAEDAQIQLDKLLNDHTPTISEEIQLINKFRPHILSFNMYKYRKHAAFAFCIITLMILSFSLGQITRNNIENPSNPDVTPIIVEPSQTPHITPNIIESTQPPESTIDANDKIVVVTRYGTKYHIPSCSRVKNSKVTFELSIEESERQGYEPCDGCRPDIR